MLYGSFQALGKPLGLFYLPKGSGSHVLRLNLNAGRIPEAFLYLRARHFLHLYATFLVARTLQLRIFRFASTYIKPSVLTLKLESPINYAHFSDLHIKVATIEGTFLSFPFFLSFFILILKYRLCAFFNS